METNRKEEDSDCETTDQNPRSVLYGVEDVPSPPVCFLFGLQQAIMCIGGTMSLPFLIPGLICAEGNNEVTSKLMSITLFMCGLATIFQTLFGIRLGIVQGGSNFFLLPIIAMMSTSEWKCPSHADAGNATLYGTDTEETWKSRMREIQGNLIVASITQVVLGCTGVLGMLLRFIGPLTIAPTIAMIGPALVAVMMELNKQHWGIAFLTMAFTLLFGAYLSNIKPPLPAWTKKRHCYVVRFPIFQLFSVILSICASWLVCLVLTVTDVFPNNSTDPSYMVRTDAKLDTVGMVPWFYVPYPCKTDQSNFEKQIMETNRKEEDSDGETTDQNPRSVLYGVEDVPSPPVCFLFGLQQAIMCIGGTMSLPFLIPGLICAEGNNEVTSKLMSITLFMCGLATIFQTLFGIRLGIVQGGSNFFLLPIIAMMSTSEWKCPSHANAGNATLNGTDTEETWKSRMREIQGNLIVASITQVVLGCTGVLGMLLRFIGPLTIAPTIAMIGPALVAVMMELNKQHWGIAFLTMAFTLLFGAYLSNIKPPLPAWTKKRHCHVVRFPIFQLFSVILSICASWLVCLVLTVTDVFPNNSTDPSYMVRTDAKLDTVGMVPWFYVPYPFQFGTPTVSTVGYVGFLVVTLVSVLESVCDYHAAARLSGAPPPPAHAVNRGIAMEGVASIFSGLVGAGHGTTSYSHNIGAIGMTKVASRAVFLTAGIILVLCGVVGKFGAVLTLIPDAVVGGSLTVLMGMIMGSGLSALKFVDLDSTRNIIVLGTSFILGLMMPEFVNDPEHADIIKTGIADLDQIIKLLLGTHLFVGGFVGCILDNTIPGTDEERGLLSWRKDMQTTSENGVIKNSLAIYEYPYVTNIFRRAKCCSYVPVSPTFDKEIDCLCCFGKNKLKHAGYENKVALDDTKITTKL